MELVWPLLHGYHRPQYFPGVLKTRKIAREYPDVYSDVIKDNPDAYSNVNHDEIGDQSVYKPIPNCVLKPIGPQSETNENKSEKDCERQVDFLLLFVFLFFNQVVPIVSHDGQVVCEVLRKFLILRSRLHYQIWVFHRIF